MNEHSITVGKVMQQLAFEKTGDQDYANDMFVLGYLHDVGKQFGYTLDHAERGGEILKKSEYKYWQEVYYHGSIDTQFYSKELDLLNTADLQVTLSGDHVSTKERLQEIASRHGEDSVWYKNSEIIAKKLGLI